MFTVGILVIWCSEFNTAAVTTPPKEAEPAIVTKSPISAPWDESVAVIVVDPLVAAKTMPLVVVALIGVISYKAPPSSI